MKAELQCPHCDFTDVPSLDWHENTNGTIHLRAECSFCGRFIKWLRQEEPWLSMLPPVEQVISRLATESARKEPSMSWDQYTKQAEVGSGGEFPEVADDLYDAIIQDVTEPREGADAFNPGKVKIDFIVKWELTGDNAPPETVLWQYVTLPEAYLNDGYLSEKSNLYKVMDALGFDMTGRFTVDPPTWQGLEARVMVENRPNQQGELRPRITGVKPKRQAKAPRQPGAAGARPARRTDPEWDE